MKEKKTRYATPSITQEGTPNLGEQAGAAQGRLEESLAQRLGSGYAESTPGQEAMKAFGDVAGGLEEKVASGELTEEEAATLGAEEETRIPVQATKLPVKFSIPQKSLPDLAAARYKKRGAQRFSLGRSSVNEI